MTEAKCMCMLNACTCCSELIAILMVALLWNGGGRRLTQAATFTDGLFRGSSHMFDSTAGKVIFTSASVWNPFRNTHRCSWLAWWKWSVFPSDAVSCPQRRKRGQKMVGTLLFLFLGYKVLGTGHLHCICPTKTPMTAFWMLHWPWGSGDHLSCLQEVDLAHCSAPLLFHT